MGRVHATNLAPMDDIEVVAFDPAFDRHDLSDVSCLMAGRSPNLCPATAATEAQNVAIAALRSLAEGAAVDVRAG